MNILQISHIAVLRASGERDLDKRDGRWPRLGVIWAGFRRYVARCHGHIPSAQREPLKDELL